MFGLCRDYVTMMIKNAVLSEDRIYRYALWRIWDESKKRVLFIGLNPSTADEVEDDSTVKRCMSYAEQWGFGGILIGNLFAYRATNPLEMMTASDPVGTENDSWLKKLTNEADLIVGVWGNSGQFKGRSIEVVSMLRRLYCLQITAKGEPHHTRGLPDGLIAIPYSNVY